MATTVNVYVLFFSPPNDNFDLGIINNNNIVIIYYAIFCNLYVYVVLRNCTTFLIIFHAVTFARKQIRNVLVLLLLLPTDSVI
jgi:hypothetical protein